MIAPRFRAAILLTALLAVGLLPARGSGQTSGPLALVNAVMRHRAMIVGDSTRFDACSVYTAVGRPADFPAGIDPSVVRLLDRTTTPCAGDPARVSVARPRYFVRVDTVAPGTGAAPRVTLTVTRGEYRYRESYTLRKGDGPGLPPTIQEVRTWGFVQSVPLPPGRRLPNLNR